MSDLHLADLTKPLVEEPIRKGFGRGLLAAGKLDINVVAACADLTDSTQMSLFKGEFPDRFVEIGVAEQNLATCWLLAWPPWAKYHLLVATRPLVLVVIGNRFAPRPA